MVRLIWRLAVLTLLVSVVTSPTGVGAEPELEFSGSGWGHGVGLSQYGARAMADAGTSSDEILDHYFPGTSVRKLDTLDVGAGLFADEDPVWVGLLQNQAEISFTVDDGAADICVDDANLCVASASEGETWTFGSAGVGLCRFTRLSDGEEVTAFETDVSCSSSVRPSTQRTTFSLPRKARSYSDAILRFRESPATGRYHLSLEIGVENYVRGVQELPDSWPGASLEAQAVVSRTIVVRRVLDHGPAESFDRWRMELCACHLMDDDPEQSFGGRTAEIGHPFWQGRVGATSGLVLTYDNTVIWARFSSSTGGRTESSIAAGDASSPYLISVDDSMSLSGPAANPFASWWSTVDGAVLGSVFGFRWLSDVQIVSRNESGSVKTVALSGIIVDRPGTVTTTGNLVRDSLGLRSSFFDVQVRARFDDVSPDHPFAGEVTGLGHLGITRGCTETSFCPSDTVTRGQMAAFLVRSLGLSESTEPTDSFVDDNGSEFEADIEILYHHGITSGCSETSYCPSDAVTREQMAAFLVRGFSLVSPGVGSDAFEDDDGSPFEAEIETLYSNGVTSGCTTTSYCPSDVVTREQMAALLIRALAVPAG